MVDSELLEDRIKEIGIKKSFIADEMGISIQSLRLKINNEYDFKMSEAGILKELLNIQPNEYQKFFFKK